jgi:hypothetical protein
LLARAEKVIEAALDPADECCLGHVAYWHELPGRSAYSDSVSFLGLLPADEASR